MQRVGIKPKQQNTSVNKSGNKIKLWTVSKSLQFKLYCWFKATWRGLFWLLPTVDQLLATQFFWQIFAALPIGTKLRFHQPCWEYWHWLLYISTFCSSNCKISFFCAIVSRLLGFDGLCFAISCAIKCRARNEKWKGFVRRMLKAEEMTPQRRVNEKTKTRQSWWG